MFSGYLRSAILTLLALTGLLMLCVPLSRADDGAPILSVYITNTGSHLTLGLSDALAPLYSRSINTWDRTELYGDPPNLMFNDSPLRFFRKALQDAAPDIRKIMMSHKQFLNAPLRVYIGSAGADGAINKPRPNDSILPLLTEEQKTKCYDGFLNRKDFFQCVFSFDIRDQLLKDSPSPQIRLTMQQDTQLINAMASQHARRHNQIKPDEVAIVVHSTTISQPYLMQNGEALSIGGWVPPDFRKKGGIYQIGKEFQSYLRHPEKEPSLLQVVKLDPRSAHHPKGIEANMTRLQVTGKGFNNFGRIVGETAVQKNSALLHANDLELEGRLHNRALAEAKPMVTNTRKAFVQMTLMLYAMTEKRFAERPPHIIIVGEESDILFPDTNTFHNTAQQVISATELGSILQQSPILTARPDLTAKGKMQTWIETRASDITQHVSIIPVSEFSQIQHQTAADILLSH